MNAGAGIEGNLAALSQLWRRLQLESTWLAALMDRYEDFRRITERALRAALRQLSIHATERQFERLMQAYLVPPVFADVRPALERLQKLPLAILSNGSPGMLADALRNNNLESYFAHVISVDSVRTYKPSPRVYTLGPQLLKLTAADILFVSSNAWDASGAKTFGYSVCWCNRSGAEFEAECVAGDMAPDFIVSRLDQIAETAEI